MTDLLVRWSFKDQIVSLLYNILYILVINYKNINIIYICGFVGWVGFINLQPANQPASVKVENFEPNPTQPVTASWVSFCGLAG